jgi:VIT1/CCC1 family predicted Fe2+/Mn2+ transporter
VEAVRPALLVLTFVGFFGLWAVLAILIRRGLRRLGSTHPRPHSGAAMLAARYAEWGENFVSFLVYWLGGALFMTVLAVVFLVTGHLAWFIVASAAALFAVLGIAAGVKYGKATPRNIWRLIVRS